MDIYNIIKNTCIQHHSSYLISYIRNNKKEETIDNIKKSIKSYKTNKTILQNVIINDPHLMAYLLNPKDFNINELENKNLIYLDKIKASYEILQSTNIEKVINQYTKIIQNISTIDKNLKKIIDKGTATTIHNLCNTVDILDRFYSKDKYNNFNDMQFNDEVYDKQILIYNNSVSEIKAHIQPKITDVIKIIEIYKKKLSQKINERDMNIYDEIIDKYNDNKSNILEFYNSILAENTHIVDNLNIFMAKNIIKKEKVILTINEAIDIINEYNKHKKLNDCIQLIPYKFFLNVYTKRLGNVVFKDANVNKIMQLEMLNDIINQNYSKNDFIYNSKYHEGIYSYFQYLILIATNQLYTKNYVIYNYINKDLIEIYKNITTKILLDDTFHHIFSNIKNKFYFIIKRLDVFFTDILEILRDTDDCIDIRTTRGEIRNDFMLFNYFKVVLESYYDNMYLKKKIVKYGLCQSKSMLLDTQLTNGKNICVYIHDKLYNHETQYINKLIQTTLNNINGITKIELRLYEIIQDQLIHYNLNTTTESIEIVSHKPKKIINNIKQYIKNTLFPSYINIPVFNVFENFEKLTKNIQSKFIYDFKLCINNKTTVNFIITKHNIVTKNILDKKYYHVVINLNKC